MKIHEYNEMMRYLTRPSKKNYDDSLVYNTTKYLNPETRIQELATGGVATPKRGLVDEPGSYGGKGKGSPGILKGGRASELSEKEKKYINKRFNKTGKPFDEWWPSESLGNANRQNYMNAFDRVELSKKELLKLKKKDLINVSELDEILTKAGKKTGVIKYFINDPAYQALKPKVIEGIYASEGPGKVRDTWFKKPNAQQIKNIIALHTGTGGNQPVLKKVTIDAINNLTKDKPFVNFLKKWNEGDDIPDKIIKKIFSPNAAYKPNTIAKYAQILDGSIPFEGIKVDKKLAEKIKKGIKFEAGGTRGSWQQAARKIAVNEFDRIFNPAGKSKLTFASRQNAIKNKFSEYGLKGLSVDEIVAIRTGYTSGQSPYSIFSQVLTNKMNTAVKNQLDAQTSKRALRLQEAIKEYGVNSKQANKIRLEQKNYIKQFRINNPEFAKANLPEFSFKSPQEVLGEKRFSTLPKEAQIAMKKSFKEQKFTPDLGKNLKTQKELAEIFSTEKEALRYLKAIGCPGKAMGGRIGFQTGTTCLTKGVEAINSGKIAKGAQARNFANFANRAYKLGRGIMKFGIIPEALFVAGESLVRMGMGDTLDEALLRSIDWITPGDQTRKADLKMLTRTIGPENAQTVLRANDYKQSLTNLNSAKANAEVDLAQNMEEFSGMSDQEVRKLGEEKIAKAEADMKAKFQPEAVMDYAVMQESEAEDIRKSNSKIRKFIETARQNQIDDIEQIAAPEKVKQPAAPMSTMDDYANQFDNEYLEGLRTKYKNPNITKKDILRAYREDEDFNKGVFQSIFEEGRLNLANRERLFGTQGTFGGQPLANGGIASLTRTTPPERGPQYRGLDYLRKHGRGY